jgi:hypothetical protein
MAYFLWFLFFSAFFPRNASNFSRTFNWAKSYSTNSLHSFSVL